MKKILAAFLSLIMAFSFAACGGDKEQAEEIPVFENNGIFNIDFNIHNRSDDLWTNDGTVNISNSVYSEISLLSSDYPKLYSKIGEINNQLAKEISDFMYEGYDLCMDNDEYLEEYWYGAYESSGIINVLRSDTNAFSFVVHYYSYLGGAHPDYWDVAFNLDPATGEEITLESLVGDLDAFKSLVASKLLDEYIEDDFFEPIEETIAAYTYEDFKFELLQGGIKVFFNPYEIGPFALGKVEAFIPFDEFDFTGEYNKLPLNPMFIISAADSVYYDFNEDGTMDNVSYTTNTYYPSYEADENTEDTSNNAVIFSLLFGSDELQIDLSEYIQDSDIHNVNIMHTEDNRNYLFIQTSKRYDEEETITEVYDTMMVFALDIDNLSHEFIKQIDDYPWSNCYLTPENLLVITGNESILIPVEE